MDSKKSKIIWFTITTSIFAGLIYLADPKRFLESLISAKPKFLIPAFILGSSVSLVFTNTWHHFLKKVGVESGYFFSFRLFMSGQFMNSVTPLGQFGGEPFMAYIIKKNTNLSYKKAFSTVLSGDIINGIPPIIFVSVSGAYLLLLGSSNNIIIQTFYAVLAIILIGIPLIYLIWFKTSKVEKAIIYIAHYISNLIGRGEKIVKAIESKIEGLEEAFEVVGDDPKGIAKTALIAHLFILIEVAGLFFVMSSLGIKPDLMPLFFITILSGLASFTPTPGGAGAFEAAMAGLITVFLGVSGSLAITTAILFRLTTYWPALIVGYICLISLERE